MFKLNTLIYIFNNHFTQSSPAKPPTLTCQHAIKMSEGKKKTTFNNYFFVCARARIKKAIGKAQHIKVTQRRNLWNLSEQKKKKKTLTFRYYYTRLIFMTACAYRAFLLLLRRKRIILLENIYFMYTYLPTIRKYY